MFEKKRNWSVDKV